MMHILRVVAVLFMAWPFTACERTLVEGLPELSVSIYIPDMNTTKAETGNVSALAREKVLSSLQIWVFIHDDTDSNKDGQLVGYKAFTAGQLTDTGLPYATTTRFGMPLSPSMFTLLSEEDAKVDVYAVANAISATSTYLGEDTKRSILDGIVLSGSYFGVESLTMRAPDPGLPMSGVLKAASVTGSYPVLNVSTVTLTRAVSKIRFVFCQQGTPAIDETPATPSNTACVIKSISFGGTSNGHDCQIAKSEKLFTDNKYGSTDNLFDIVDYIPLTATLAGENGADLMSNADISVLEYPEALLFRSAGHTTESAQEYETRLDAAVAQSSQLGPIYLRETDKPISGTIVYNVGEGDVEATFSMPSDDVLSRNHSWILYAYFAETTKTLQLKIVVLPWDKSIYDMGFTTSPYIVNVVRRFTIPETDPHTFAKVQNTNGYYDIHFWPILNDQPNVVKGDILIDAPVGQTICVVPVAGAEEGYTPVENIFSIVSITPREHIILSPYHEQPENSRSEDSVVEYTISCNIPDGYNVDALEGNYIDLHFCVKIVDGDKVRWIDLDSESIDYYRIYFHKNWVNYLPEEE